MMNTLPEVKTMDDMDFSGKRVLVRVDFNVPLDDALQITDDTRITSALPTIDHLRKKEAAVIVMSHLGRPKGKYVEKYSLKPVFRYLQKLYGAQNVFFTADCIGEEAKAAAASLQMGQVLLLENLRFHDEEEANDTEFAKKLASLADLYVNDAFGTAHRAHASTVGVVNYLPGCAGLLLAKEIDILTSLFRHPKTPFVAVMGGAKISDKIAVIENLLAKVDWLLIGGGMGNTFLAAQGYPMQASLFEAGQLGWAQNLLALPEAKKLVLPVDLVAADKFAAGAQTKIVAVDAIPEGWQALDIGPETGKAYAKIIQAAATIVWNGPMGVFEIDDFARGTIDLAKAVAASAAFSVVGGGDSVAAIQKAGVQDRIGHISTGGGATLEFLEGKSFPAIVALTHTAK